MGPLLHTHFGVSLKVNVIKTVVNYFRCVPRCGCNPGEAPWLALLPAPCILHPAS